MQTSPRSRRIKTGFNMHDGAAEADLARISYATSN
jgi:hypothetical protein